jgi:multiple sugar transport system substrate-binding protein
VTARQAAPYGTLINDPKLSKTGDKWTWDTVPGKTDKAQSKSCVRGHFLAVPKYTKNKESSLRFIKMAYSKQWMKRSMSRGDARPRGSVLRGPEIVKVIGWTEVAAKSIETGILTPAKPIFPAFELSVRAGLSQCLPGQKSAKQALDDVAADWQRAIGRAGGLK